MGVIEDIYVRDLKKEYTGYRNHICLQVINNLKANYYKINPEELKINTARMNTPYNINEPFKTIIDNINTAIDLSDARKFPYTL